MVEIFLKSLPFGSGESTCWLLCLERVTTYMSSTDLSLAPSPALSHLALMVATWSRKSRDCWRINRLPTPPPIKSPRGLPKSRTSGGVINAASAISVLCRAKARLQACFSTDIQEIIKTHKGALKLKNQSQH